MRLAAEPGLVLRAAVRHDTASLPQDVDTVYVGDCGPDTDWTAALAGVTVVVHAAARVHEMRDTAADSLATYRRVNTDGTLNLGRQAAAAGVRRFIFLSTIKVNGERTLPDCPFTAGDAPAPADPYAISKLEAETGLRRIADGSGMEVVILRLPMVYGPGVKGNFARLLRAVVKGGVLPFGAVDNRRSLVGIDNLVDLITVCIDHPAVAGQTLLVSDGEDLSTSELIRHIAASLHRPARLIPVPVPLLRLGAMLVGRREDIDRLTDSLQIDIRGTCELLGWTPPVGIHDGLLRCVHRAR